MTRPVLVWTIAGALLGALLAALAVRLVDEWAKAPQPSEFARQLDLSPLRTVAVQTEGRLKSYHSFANSMVRRVVGPRPPSSLRAHSHAYTYLDMMLRPELYERRNIIHIANKPIRSRIASRLQRRADLPEGYIDGFVRTGMIAPALLTDDLAVRELLLELRSDAVAAARHATAIENALIIRRSETLADQLRIIPPRSGGAQAAWGSVAELFAQDAGAHRHHDAAEADVAARATLQTPVSLRNTWRTLAVAWRAEDAPAASEAIATIARALPNASPEGLYPEQSRLWWESWYDRAGHMTWVWMVYMLSIALLLLATAHRWPAAARAGFVVFIVAAALHTFAVGLRWYVSGRWPNANMFEAVTTSAWFGAVGALALELAARRTPMRCFFALGAAFCAAAALLAARLLPVSLDPGVANMAPILHDVWLYIHTNVVIFSYCLIGMAAVSAGLYMLHRLAGAAPDSARHGGAGAMLAMGRSARAAAGGSSSAPNTAQILDAVTMVLLELAFILLWAGIVMGAVWADHSWGRPWGWDPKEVFALNTFVIFVILIHVRMKSRDKGLWTASLALVGFVSMLFNWIVINFVIAGLHSYA